MGLEKDVLSKVAKVLKSDNQAGFMFGTLFVTCTENEARKIFLKLTKGMFGKVLVSKLDGEFAFDFTA